MSKYADTLSRLHAQEQSLLTKRNDLITKLKIRVGDIAERFECLTIPDALIIGLFMEAQKALKNKPEQVKIWEQNGKSYLDARRRSKRSIAASKSSRAHPSAE